MRGYFLYFTPIFGHILCMFQIGPLQFGNELGSINSNLTNLGVILQINTMAFENNPSLFIYAGYLTTNIDYFVNLPPPPPYRDPCFPRKKPRNIQMDIHVEHVDQI